jgi:hypothetical protein
MAVAGGGGTASPAPAAGFFVRHDCCGCGGGEEFGGLGLLARSRRRRRRGSASLDSGWTLISGPDRRWALFRPKLCIGILGPLQLGFFSLLKNLLFF